VPDLPKFSKMSKQGAKELELNEAQRLLAEELKAWEETLKIENEAKEAARRTEAANKVVQAPLKGPRLFSPFEGAALSRNFPKTPLNFHKGERVFAVDKEEEVGKGKAKHYNPFEGVPLSKDFPKTPMKFWKGHVVGEPRIVVTYHDAEKEVEGVEKVKGKGREIKDDEGDDRSYD
jgi:hypothetical protein